MSVVPDLGGHEDAVPAVLLDPRRQGVAHYRLVLVDPGAVHVSVPCLQGRAAGVEGAIRVLGFRDTVSCCPLHGH